MEVNKDNFKIAESTFGGGEKKFLGTRRIISGLAYACTESASKFIFGGLAHILSATSF